MRTVNSDAVRQEGIPADKNPATLKDMIVIALICLLAGALILMPKYLSFDPFSTLFYARNAGTVAMLGLCLYALIIYRVTGLRERVMLFMLFAIPAAYINLLPADKSDQSLILACIHLPLLLWCVYGIVYTRFSVRDIRSRVAFIRHNGDLAIMGALIILAGMLLAGFTIALFASADINIEKFYSEYVGIWGVVAAPAVTAFIIYHYPKITGRIAPVIANLFSPFLLVTLIIYLLVILISGKDPYTDRDFLIMFNLMLAGVMAVIVFSVSEATDETRKRFRELVLLLLSAVAMIIDIIALSAIFYRLGEYGITANRVAVLGSNLLFLGNLILITIDLVRVNFRSLPVERVSYTTARYLPLYMLWTVIVVFAFPLLFNS